ncbi:9516_t:CDS:2 [Ambispora leptoticha]|uniref:9516_t:CDS:1 n=1 Tax=Ambispora leptoticha TaxID=144679 RepID=A0A9N9FVB1_9GLOM|nr:9516_t:CDS:2 [Ambispora leptoticha]
MSTNAPGDGPESAPVPINSVDSESLKNYASTSAPNHGVDSNSVINREPTSVPINNICSDSVINHEVTVPIDVSSDSAVDDEQTSAQIDSVGSESANNGSDSAIYHNQTSVPTHVLILTPVYYTNYDSANNRVLIPSHVPNHGVDSDSHIHGIGTNTSINYEQTSVPNHGLDSDPPSIHFHIHSIDTNSFINYEQTSEKFRFPLMVLVRLTLNYEQTSVPNHGVDSDSAVNYGKTSVPNHRVDSNSASIPLHTTVLTLSRLQIMSELHF